MERFEYLYYFQTAAGKSYTVVNGVPSVTVMPTALNHAPDGWKEQMINYVRNSTYYGIFRSYSIALRVVKDGALILRDKLYQFGIEEVVVMLILKKDNLSGKMKGFYKGEVDMSKCVDTLDSIEFTVMEGGFPKYLKAYESTNFEIPFSVPRSTRIPSCSSRSIL